MSYQPQPSALSDEEKAAAISKLQAQIDSLIAKLTQLKAKMDELGKDNWPTQLGNAMAKSFDSMNNVVNRSIGEWTSGHKTFAQSMYAMWNGLAQNAIQNLLKVTEKTVEQLLIRKVVNISTEQATVAAHGAAAAESAAITKSSAFEEQLAYAKAAAAKAYSALASIPIVGPELGAIAAAATFAAILAFEQGGIVPSAPDGTGIPSMLHSNEMVLPERISTFIQERAAAPAAAAAGAAGGDTHFHINALDPQTMMSWLGRNSGMLGKHLKGMYRDGWRPR